MKADSVVRARIPAEMKKQAMITLERMGLSASDLIRITFCVSLKKVVCLLSLKYLIVSHVKL
ncbi:type II toxin-antitoxin system RelB/DinJ family antitoxin [Bartonella doshiae]|uniref:Antitoxin DinJ n=2 Tax=Bartonella doshiae TaxID=33044 RepID=A0A380ZEI9_BARDO|nr:hypothetical protein MCS_01371 [Bartonella doshiae NCTC 12862 = ATCC 700133]SUV45387.1 Antitoxin DinJ [Bartonella doshiae]